MSTGSPFVIVQATATGNVLEKNFNEPPTETVNARLEQVGVFRENSVGANQSATALTFQAIDANAPVAFVAGRSGQIVGLVARMASTTTIGAIASGTATAQATVGGVAAGDTAVMTATADTLETIFTTPVPFNKGDRLGANVSSSSLSPTTSNANVWLLIRWTGHPTA